MNEELLRPSRQASGDTLYKSFMSQHSGITSDVRHMQKMIEFDKVRRDKVNTQIGLDAEEYYQIHQTWLSKLKYLVMVLYFFFVPLTQTPQWCLTKRQYNPNFKCDGDLYATFGTPKYPPYVTNSVDFACICFLCLFKFFKLKWRLLSHQGKARNWALLAVSFISCLDLVMSTFFCYQPVLTNLLRPVVVLIFLRQLREQAKLIVLVVKDSSYMVGFFFFFIMFFALMGHFVFKGTLKDYTFFENLQDSLQVLLGILATADFQDVMLPAYEQSKLSSIFFVVYLGLGTFCMMNLLLAVFYSNYKARLERKVEANEESRTNYIIDVFTKFDIGMKGYLTVGQCRSFFSEVLNIKYLFSLLFNLCLAVLRQRKNRPHLRIF